jgi:predicted nucleic acid-binding protein
VAPKPVKLDGPALFDTGVWTREVHLLPAPDGDHRHVPPADLLLAAAAEAAGVPLVHYDRDYERVATVIDLEHRWMVTDGSLA